MTSVIEEYIKTTIVFTNVSPYRLVFDTARVAQGTLYMFPLLTKPYNKSQVDNTIIEYVTVLRDDLRSFLDMVAYRIDDTSAIAVGIPEVILSHHSISVTMQIVLSCKPTIQLTLFE